VGLTSMDQPIPEEEAEAFPSVRTEETLGLEVRRWILCGGLALLCRACV